MVSVEDSVIARISKAGLKFEILVDPEKVLEFKRGKQISIEELLAVNEIFEDARKGDRVSSEDLKKVFNTDNVLKVAEIIIKEGQFQLTTEQRKKLIEEKKKQIANIISKQGIDPRTKVPHPPQRILEAMKKAGVNIDPFKPAKEQVKPIVEKLQEIMPISFEMVKIAIKVPIEYSGKVNSVIREFAEVENQEWKTSFWFALIKIPGGMQGDLYDKLNKLTAGKVEIKVIE